ncbi:hypothetical protein [Laspinema olomoucense]|uniref:Uncharacterized protein n=1 Tax=Laspinema olomoucense D3b TaxID=2953688 RepID=A0ABT2N850_9CYAN|nr:MULTISPECIES: hypothetical protein [unclassified Laspinema]MCT7972897.1 hypothetical protein [Laspinema sp. D3d]MCT7978859.1 hypothetical protein [Laspinema sp. D3b]MCT7988411.1 hypothetical protein [Laspinema sp. D3a]MCT7996454.1 hypothetical protein [Laspinema sp. D3c]
MVENGYSVIYLVLLRYAIVAIFPNLLNSKRWRNEGESRCQIHELSVVMGNGQTGNRLFLHQGKPLAASSPDG